MKKFIIILLFIPFLAIGQKWKLTCGEYTIPGADSIGRMVYFSGATALTGNGGSGTPGVPLPCTAVGVTFTSTYGTLHGGGGIDNTGHVWYAGNNDEGQSGLGGVSANIGTFTKITTDSLGNDFSTIKFAQGFFIQIGATLAQGTYFVKQGVSEDSVFACGLLNYGMAMNGTAGSQVTRPWLVYFRAGHHILEMSAEKAGIILFDDGAVGTWGGNGNYTQLGYAGSGNQFQNVHILSGFAGGEVIRHVCGGDVNGFLLAGTVKQLYGIGQYAGYFGNAGNPSYGVPTDLTDSVTSYILTGGRTSITAICGNSNCFHVLANDGTLWSWGDAAMGSIGNGVEPNMATLPFPWFPDPTVTLLMPITHPVQITKKSNFTNIYGGCLFTFVFFALDANGQLYACGRNKGSIIPNGVVECAGANGDISANYPNSWDLPYLTPINPYGVISTFGASCPGCKTGAVTSFCSECTIPSTTPSANAGGNQNITTSTTTLDGSGSTCTGGKITYYLWTQVSGEASTIDVPAAIKPNISGLSPGTYVFSLKIVDNGFNTSNQNVTVTVTNSSCKCTYLYGNLGTKKVFKKG